MRSTLGTLLCGGALLSFTTLGCGAEDERPEAEPVERTPVPESEFKAYGLEDTVELLATEIDRTQAAELRLGVVLGGGDASWDDVEAGVERAFSELGAQGAVVAPADQSDSEQIELIKREREESSQGIGVAPLADTLEAEVDRALEAGIPVVTMGKDLSDSGRELFVGFGEYEIGQRLGDAVLELMTLREGTVVILGSDDEKALPEGYQRSLAAKAVMEESGIDVVIRNSSTLADGEARDIETIKNDLLNSDERPLAVIGVLETSYRVALAATAADRVLEQADPSGEANEEPGLSHLANVMLIGYGLQPATLEALRSEVFDATLAPRRHYMGYVVPYVLAGLNLLGEERTRYLLTPHLLDNGTLDVGMDLIVPEELDAYVEFQTALTR
jgi:ribose transport system substrate-binding protein